MVILIISKNVNLNYYAKVLKEAELIKQIFRLEYEALRGKIVEVHE
jgi:hypothetical protein